MYCNITINKKKKILASLLILAFFWAKLPEMFLFVVLQFSVKNVQAMTIIIFSLTAVDYFYHCIFTIQWEKNNLQQNEKGR
jgi:hypothetical protein